MGNRMSSQQIILKKPSRSMYNQNIILINAWCGCVDMSLHRYVIFNIASPIGYRCKCKDQHIMYERSHQVEPSYLFCSKSNQVYLINREFTGRGNQAVIVYCCYRPCLQQDVLWAYREKQKSKILKIYNKLRLVLHHDIVRHVIHLLVRNYNSF
jgi:hypothetical protein